LLRELLQVLFGGVIGSISMAIVADLFLAEQRGRVMGFLQMGFGSSQVLGIPISLFLANSFGWQSPFLMIVGLATIIWLIIVIKMQPITQHLEVKNDRKRLTSFMAYYCTKRLSYWIYVNCFIILRWLYDDALGKCICN
jgi:predicted MFS family arabinose efflux permease